MNQLHYHKGKKSDLGFYDHVSWRILEKYKHLQQKADQWLVFAAMRQKISPFCLSIVNEKLTYIPAKNYLFSLQYEISSLRPAIIYENFMFTQKHAFTERCCFLTFSFEAKLRKYNISVTETYENKQKHDLFCSFHKCS